MAGPHVEAALVVIRQAGRVLVTRRRPDAFLGGLLEFPGGKIEPGETPEACAVREAEEELGVRVRLTGRREPIEWDYADRHVTLHPFDAVIVEGRPPDSAQRLLPAELRLEDFPPASERLIADLQAE